MGVFLDREAELEDRVRRLEQRVSDLEFVGRPRYGTTNESKELPITVVMPQLHTISLKDLRLARGLKLREVEEATGISNAYLSQLETGKIKSPSYDTMRKLFMLYCNGA